MAGTFKFELVTPERMAVSEDATEVIVPGAEGEFTVLAGHSPVVSTLRPGILNATLASSKKVRLFVKDGFAECDTGHLTILAERAIDVEALTGSALAAEIQRSEAELAAATDDAARFAASSALAELRALQG
ncbi:MAG: F0F1 ATP synthase subunit epsilon [Hyphomicrobiales bacterium]|jgi:F-type H+-transporting ATPase subunit epsilon|nr:MAG: F0F1 ATP synthase subunit epsilon [Hyphomicrobiales bacterium]